MKNMNDLISVIIPVYKVEEYLDDCMRSILDQTYRNLEIILVDDGGTTDRCPEMCDEYAAADERIKVIHKKNGGLSDARNAGLEIATGRWIVFIDSDDYAAPDMIMKLADAADRTGAQLVWCGFKEISAESVYSKDKFGETDKDNSQTEIKVRSNKEAEMLFYEPGKMGECMVAWNKLYLRDLFFDDDKIRYPKGKIFEDGYTTYKLIYKAEKVAVIDEAMYFYRQRKDSIMNKNADRNYRAAREAGAGKLKFFIEHDEKELYLKELNLNIYSAIRFYEAAQDKTGKKETREWFFEIYNEYFKKEKWPAAKKLRMKAFAMGYPFYKVLSMFEGTYNKLKK